MRNINEMMKLIPPDELNGGITMKSTNRTDDNKSNISDSRSGVKLKRGTSGLVAAALVLAVGGGALAVSLGRSGAAPAASGAESITASAGQSQAAADAAAEKFFKLINVNLSAYISDGFVKDIRPGEFTYNAAFPDEAEDTAKRLVAKSLDPGKFYSAEHQQMMLKEIGDIPESGEVFFVVNSQYKVVFVQYREAPDSAVGQYSIPEFGRRGFGEAPDNLLSAADEPIVLGGSNSHAHAVYELIKRMANDYLYGDRYDVNTTCLLNFGSGIMLDFDKREQYADQIWRLEKYNYERIPLTGKVYFEVILGNDPMFVQWQSGEGGDIEIWPYAPDSADGKVRISRLGDIPEGKYEYFVRDDSDKTMSCNKAVLDQQNGQLTGVTTERTNMPEVFKWYESFLAKNYKPLTFYSDRIKTASELGTVTVFEWKDTERNENVIIRTSDMKGANIYVNGRYYNVEDTSVLELLDKGMPPAASSESAE